MENSNENQDQYCLSGMYVPPKQDAPNHTNNYNHIPNGTFIVGNKLMGQCAACGKIVRIDKPFLGSLHICN